MSYIGESIVVLLLLLLPQQLLAQKQPPQSQSQQQPQGEKLTGLHVNAISDEEQLLPGAPRFVEEPQTMYYVTPKSPAVVECVVDQAMYVTVHCNGRALNKKVEITSDHERPERQKFQATVDFTDVHQWFGNGDYYCNCEAWGQIPALKNELRKVISSKAYIRLAYFETDRFQFDPVPQSVSLDANNIILSCTPPKGSPKPKVKWLKDGRPLDIRRYGDRVTIDHQAQLIIRPLRTEDRGNYSCLAEIPGHSVASKPAQLTVYVNGGWSHWSQWLGCDPRCEAAPDCRPECAGQQRSRERRCDAPKPEFGGQQCLGSVREVTPCSSKCTVQGQWGEWSEWSQCSSDCLANRQRRCDSPAPAGGGRPCPAGASGGQDWRNCTEGRLCKRDNTALLMFRNVGTHDGTSGTSDSTPGLANIAIYVGLVVAAAVLVTIALVIVYLVKKKTVSFGSNRRDLRYNVHMNGNSSMSSSSGKDAKITHELLLPPTSASQTIKNGGGVMLEMTASAAFHQQQQQQQQQQQLLLAAGGGEQALRVHLPMSQAYQQHHQQGALHHRLQLPGAPASISGGSAGVYSNGQMDDAKSSMVSSPCGSQAGGGGCLASRPCSALYQEPASLLGVSRQLTAACVPPGLGADQVAWGTVGPAGGRLCLPDSGVSLTIPPGALPPGSREDLFLATCRDERDRPALGDRQTLLSSIVACGPASLPLVKPVIITMPHAACLRHGFWNVTVMRFCEPPSPTSAETSGVDSLLLTPEAASSAAATSCGIWREHLRVGSESAASAATYCQLDTGACHLMLDGLGRYCLVGQSLEGGSAVKQLRVAAFASGPGGGVASSEVVLRVHALPDTGDALAAVLAAERLAGWRLVDAPRQLSLRDSGQPLCIGVEDLSLGWRCRSRRLEVPFGHVWSCGQAGLHCSLTLEQVDPTRMALACCLAVYQAGAYNARLALRVNCSRAEQPGISLLDATVAPIASATASCCSTSDPLQPVFRLPPKLRAALCHLLDAPNARGSDWHQLTRLMGLDRQVGYFASRPSPTDCVLDLWEARCRQEGARADLSEALRAMGRQDAAFLIDQDPAAWL